MQEMQRTRRSDRYHQTEEPIQQQIEEPIPQQIGESIQQQAEDSIRQQTQSKRGIVPRCLGCQKTAIIRKLRPDGYCDECHEAQFAELLQKHAQKESQLTPDVVDVKNLKAQIKRLSQLAQQITDDEEKCRQLSTRVEQLSEQVIELSDVIEMESFALYKPKYKFTKSDEYKKRLDSIRANQKEMIRNDKAIFQTKDWTVNNSKSEGRKLVSDMAKLCLRSFNNECDSAIESVRFSNFSRQRERIHKAAETIGKLGRVMQIVISERYLESKFDELTLAFEYQQMKEKEKEEAKIIREQQREEARAAKEMEEARKEAEKERTHYLLALNKLNEKLAKASSDEARTPLLERLSELTGYLGEIDSRLKEIDYRQENQRAGYVYIISNIGAFGESVYKIGMTRRLEPLERVDELGGASVPFTFDVHAMIFTSDAPKLESALHNAFADRRLNMVNNRREFFQVSLDEIKRVVRSNHDKTVEFTEIPEAQQYRESILLRDRKMVRQSYKIGEHAG